MNWWKIELDASGAILTCLNVGAKQAQNKYTRYIEASSAAEAATLAKQWWAEHKVKKAASNASYKEKQIHAVRTSACVRADCNKPAWGGLCDQHSRERREKAEASVARKQSRDARAGYQVQISARDPFSARIRAVGDISAEIWTLLIAAYDAEPAEFRGWLELNRDRKMAVKVA